jgi:hypothetical protein
MSALDIPTIEIPTDAALVAIAEEQAKRFPGYDNRLPYFLYDEGSEYEPALAALRAAWLDGCLTAAAALAREEEVEL